MGLRVPVANGEPHRPASLSKKLKADWVGREARRKLNNSEDLSNFFFLFADKKKGIFVA